MAGRRLVWFLSAVLGFSLVTFFLASEASEEPEAVVLAGDTGLRSSGEFLPDNSGIAANQQKTEEREWLEGKALEAEGEYRDQQMDFDDQWWDEDDFASSATPIAHKSSLSFLERVSILEPPLLHSVTPQLHYNGSFQLNLTRNPLERLPPIPANSRCRPRKFGLTPDQAAATFVEKKPMNGCGNPHASFFNYYNGDERLGDVPYRITWKRANGNVSLGDSEFAFGRCGVSSKAGVLVNRFNATAAARAKNITERLRVEVGLKEPPRPIGVYLLVFDSVSRQHFYRNLPKTVEYINEHTNRPDESDYSVFDFAINNAEGENTPPNMISMLYGFELANMKKLVAGLSHQRNDHAESFVKTQNHSMWKLMEEMGFVTLFGFDTIWDYLSPYTGRVIDTDHMISNFYHAARRVVGYNEFSLTQRCIGNFNAHYFPLNYLADYHRNYRGYNRFAYIHVSTGHEHTGTVIKTADEDLKNMLKRFIGERQDEDEDFVLMVAADHGLHVGSWDKVYEGFIENQLPLHLLITNNGLLSRLGPDVHKRLAHNSRRLVTRFDWYLTFRHLSTLPYGLLAPDSPLYQSWKQKTETPNAVSLLMEDIPDSRRCEDVGIPMYYCSCLTFDELNVEAVRNQSPVPEIVELGLNFINGQNQLTDSELICQKLTLKDVQKVLVQELDPTARNYKVRFTVTQSDKAKYDAIVFVAPASTFSTLQISENDSLHPVTTSASGLKLQVSATQLKELVRADEYAGLCERLARAFDARPALCICRWPAEDEAFQSPRFVQKVEEILAPLTLYVPNRATTCSSACSGIGKGCSEWALALLNDERVLTQPWKSKSSLVFRFQRDASERAFSDLTIVSRRREGQGLRLKPALGRSDAWEILMADWGKLPTCGDRTAAAQQLCACY